MQKRSNAEVGRIVRSRRKELKMTEADLQAAAGIDSKTLKALEKGTRTPHEKTELKVEPALRWAPGSIEQLRAGGNPVEFPDGGAPPAPTIEDIPIDELLGEIRRRVLGRVDEDEPLAPPGHFEVEPGRRATGRG